MNKTEFPASVLVSVLIAFAAIISARPAPWNQADESPESQDLWQRSRLSEELAEHPSWRTVEIVAEVERVRDPMNLIQDVHPGSEITGTYTFDSRALDRAADPRAGRYRFFKPPFGVVLTVGRYTFGSDPRDVDFDIDIGHHDLDDRFSFLSRNNVSQPALRNGGRAGHIGNISWHLHDFTGTRLAGDELPPEPPRVGEWKSLIGLRIDGTATDRISGAEGDFLIIAKVTRAEFLTP